MNESVIEYLDAEFEKNRASIAEYHQGRMSERFRSIRDSCRTWQTPMYSLKEDDCGTIDQWRPRWVMHNDPRLNIPLPEIETWEPEVL